MKPISKKLKKQLLKNLLLPRLIEEKMLILLRQGKISKWFSGIGQEAISVGCTMALQEDDHIFTMHRNLGVFTSRNIPLDRLFCQWQGKPHGFTKGRDRSFHFGSKEHNIVGMISHLGPQLSVAAGVALGNKLKDNKQVALAFTGEGGTSQGEFHEALNVASVWKIPVIFVIENNGYGLSTPTSEQYACQDLAERAKGYGMKSTIINGNDIETVYQTVHNIANEIRDNPEPYLIECKTFRVRGHEEASGVKYVPKELIEKWKQLDPVETYEQYLIENNVVSMEEVSAFREKCKALIKDGLALAAEMQDVNPDLENEMQDVYADLVHIEKNLESEKKEKVRMIDAIKKAHQQAMANYNNLVIMGQDVAEYGGVFKITEGLVDQYGRERVRNTPLCESAIVGISLGLSMVGYKSIMEMQFADFVTCGFNQIINNLAKIHYRWGHAADVVIRMPTGAGVGAGPYHSQSNEAWFFHTPGLKIVYPSNPQDAQALLLAAIEDPNPVMYFEHKALYRSLEGEVSEEIIPIEIGKANLEREGNEISIITYGMGVHWAKELVEELSIDGEILDLRSLAPLDFAAIDKTVKNTGRVLVLHEDCMTGGIGGEIAAYVGEQLFEYLDAPVTRVASLDTPVPFAKALENQFLPKNRAREAILKLVAY